MTQDPLTLYKLIVLYMLNKVKFKLTYAQISEFILEKEYTNFLTLQEVISDLQDTELIKADTTMNRTYFSITDEGRNTLSYFGNRIGEAIIADIDAFLDEKHLELKNYVLGGPYLSFIKYKGNSFRFWRSVPLFPELWEITYVFGGFTLLLFILYILLFYELTITDKKKYVKKK